MSCIQAGTDTKFRQTGNKVTDFFQRRTHGRSHPRRVFNQYSKMSKGNAPCRLFDALDDRCDRAAWRAFSARTGMHDKEVRAELNSPHQFVMKRLNRSCPQHWLLCREVNQIVGMYDERAKAKLTPPRSKSSCICARNSSRPQLPHPGAGGKNLQRVAT